MTISTADLRAEFDRARLLWGPTIDLNETAHGLPRRLLYAIASRETNLDPYWVDHVGDGGYAFGLCQIDRRWHEIPSDWAGNIDWQFRKAAELLVAWYEACGDWQGAVSAYNCGRCDPAYEYGVDVMERVSRLQSFDGPPDCTALVLRTGDSGVCVGELQRALDITDDEDFGPLTRQAVVAFQQHARLTVDGIVGSETWAALGARDCSRRVLRLGDRGDCVGRLQRALQIADDGVFRPATRRAVHEFQVTAGLDADGVVGAQTWAALLPATAGVAGPALL
jgi:murein L,D-transpeptidase YcbB/YkuD